MLKRAMATLMFMAVAMAATWALAQTGQTDNTGNKALAAAVKQASNAKDTATALARATELEASDAKDALWADNARTIANLMWRSGKHAEAATWLDEKAASLAADTADLAGDVRDQRKSALVGGCLDLVKLEADQTARAALARTALTISDTSNGAFLALYNALAASQKHDDALKACLDYSGKAATAEAMRSRRLALMVNLKRMGDLKAEATEYLKVATDPAGATKALAHVLPTDDVALCCGLTAQQVLDGRKLELRRVEGKLNSQMLLALADQLTKGGTARPLAISDDAKALADTLTGAPLAAFLIPLLRGEYPAAFREAYARAKAAENDRDYVAWVNAAAGAIRCMEQHYNGKALEFVKFVNGTVATNPVADLVNP
jgi:hypothetical protein